MAIHYAKDEQQIVTLTLDRPGRSANVIDAEFGVALATTLERLQAEPNLAGVIVSSAKKTFMAGGDLEWLYAATDAAEIFRSAEALKAGFPAAGKAGGAGGGGHQWHGARGWAGTGAGLPPSRRAE
jgi:3-hydroxyacyl-CoA dehydrogenase/enoyl-CoA hydratase/3-hydroxybutyryl-CoA epimerase